MFKKHGRSLVLTYKGNFFIVWMNRFVFNKKRWHAIQVEKIIWENLLDYGGWLGIGA
jgi:hypothetical protein